MQDTLSHLLALAGIMYFLGAIIGIGTIDRLQYLRRPSNRNRTMRRTFIGVIVGEVSAFGGYATIVILMWSPITPPVGVVGWVFTGVTMIFIAGFIQALAWVVARVIIEYDPDRANRPTVLR